MVSDLGKCRICEVEDATYRCSLCGRPVCNEHYVPAGSMCIICYETLCEICSKGLSIGYCSVCGRICCEDCLIQVSLTKYICKNCYRAVGRGNV